MGHWLFIIAVPRSQGKCSYLAVAGVTPDDFKCIIRINGVKSNDVKYKLFLEVVVLRTNGVYK